MTRVSSTPPLPVSNALALPSVDPSQMVAAEELRRLRRSGVLWLAVGFGFVLLIAIGLGFLAANPVWSTIIITTDVLVIYAVTVHGREVKSSYA